MSWPEPISVGAFEKAGFHYISRTVSTRTPASVASVGSQNTMVVHLHEDIGDPDKQWFLLRRNTIYETWKAAREAAEQGKYGVWFEGKIEGRLERVG
jgi:hypothetical protein